MMAEVVVEVVADVIVRPAHIHTMPSWNSRPGMCMRGARAWAKRHGIDWGAFVKNGIPASSLEATGDALALRLVAHARAQEARRG